MITSGHTNELKRDFGWLGGCGNMPASYLVGFLTGYRGLELNVSKAILDIGTFSPIGGSRLFAALKGAIDAGLNIPHNEKILPDESRIRGEHIADYANLIFEMDPEKYERHFSKYLERGLDPRGLPEHFDAIKDKMSEKYEGG